MPGDETARDKLIAMFEQRMDDQARKLAKGEIDILDWHVTMREDLRKVHALELIAGAGGSKENVPADDWLKLGSELRSQYLYLEDFGRAIANGDLSEDAIAARAKLYARSGRVSYWRQAIGDVPLPNYPCDGSTQCRVNCLCSVDVTIEADDDGNAVALAYWRLDGGEHCDDCKERASQWNPLRIPLGEAA